MRRFSIVKCENSYLVQSEGENILRCRTKRDAQRAAADARKLFAQDTSEQIVSETQDQLIGLA